MEYKSWIVGAAFIILLCLEHSRPAVKFKGHSALRIIKNLSFWPVNIGLSLLIVLPISYFAAQNAIWTRPEWFSGWFALALHIIILDIYLYCWHRIVHEVSFFWRFHEVHHLDEHLDTTSAIRFHFGEIFFSMLVRAVIIMLFAIPFSTVVVFEALVLIFTLFHHSNIALPPRIESFLSKIIVTPSIHWVHHHAVRKDTDSNYGTIFSFWDPLFHTKSKTERIQGLEIGVEGIKDKSFISLILAPFYRK